MDVQSVTQQMKALKAKAAKARKDSQDVIGRTFARGAARLSRKLRRAAAKLKAAGTTKEAG